MNDLCGRCESVMFAVCVHVCAVRVMFGVCVMFALCASCLCWVRHVCAVRVIFACLSCLRWVHHVCAVRDIFALCASCVCIMFAVCVSCLCVSCLCCVRHICTMCVMLALCVSCLRCVRDKMRQRKPIKSKTHQVKNTFSQKQDTTYYILSIISPSLSHLECHFSNYICVSFFQAYYIWKIISPMKFGVSFLPAYSLSLLHLECHFSYYIWSIFYYIWSSPITFGVAYYFWGIISFLQLLHLK